MRIGLIVLLALAALTIIEYIFAVEVEANAIPILFILQVKAALILWFFMHVARNWTKGAH